MKIALVRRGFSASGGAEAYLRRLASGLRDAGHEPILVTSHDWPDAGWIGSPIIRIPGISPRDFAVGARAAAACCDCTFSMERIGACDIFRAGDGVHAAWQDRRARFEPSWRGWFRRFNRKNNELLQLERETLARHGAKSIIANSAMVRDEILRYSAFPSENIRVIPNGFSHSTDSPFMDRAAARAAIGISPDAPVILFAGSGWERKGLRFAIEAMRSIPRPATLLVAGRGRWLGALPDNVRLVGAANDMSGLFAAADIFVAPTLYDPFSNACLEALAAGLPVVTTDANGFSEIIDPERTGSIVPVGDSQKLGESLLRWIADPDRGLTRERCRSLAANYSIERNVTATLEVIMHSAA